MALALTLLEGIMQISKAAATILVLACITAGAGATYLFVGSETPPPATPPPQEEPAVEPAAAAVAPSSLQVQSKPGSPAFESARPATPAAVATRAPRPAPRPQPVVESPPAPEPSPEPSPAPRAEALPPAVGDARATTSEGPSRPVPEPTPVIDVDAPVFEDLAISADAVIGLELESTISSERARVEDSVTARVARDVRVGGRLAIPAGSRALGEVTLVERGGKLRDRARLGIRFTSLVLADGTRLPIETETIYREGEAPGRESTTKIGGGAIGGAILGGILGGAKGAAIGGSIGAGAGTAAVVAGDRNAATLTAGTPLTVRLEEPVLVTVER